MYKSVYWKRSEMPLSGNVSFWTEVVIWQDWRVGGTLQVMPNVLVSHNESNLSNSILLRMKMGA